MRSRTLRLYSELMRSRANMPMIGAATSINSSCCVMCMANSHSEMVAIGDDVYFITEGTPQNVFRSDGTEAGTVKPVLFKTFPLHQADTAHAELEAGDRRRADSGRAR